MPSTLEDTQTAVELFISPHPDDGAEVTHFKITDITGGTLFLADNVTIVQEGDFITLDQARTGLIFVPDADSNTDGNFNAQASTVENDSGLGGDLATATIEIDAVNDAPVATITASYSINENTPFTLHGTGLSVGDPDTDATSVQVTLSVGEGILSVAAGTTGVTVTGSGSSRVTLDGTLGQINALLAGGLGASISYAAIDAPSPSTTLTLDIDDLGNGGAGGSLSATASTMLTITAENDSPTSLSLAQNTVVEVTDSRSGLAVGTLSSTDLDGDDTATYSIVGGAHQALFSIGEANTLMLTDGILDFETRPSYSVTVRITDSGGLTLDQTFAISVANLATAITAGQRFTVAETAADFEPVGTIATTGDTPTRFAITSGNVGNAFVVDANGLLSLSENAPLDFETTPSYTLSIEASDGTSTVAVTVFVDITDVTESTTDNGQSFNPASPPSSGTVTGSTDTSSPAAPAAPAPAPSSDPTSDDPAPVEEADVEDNTEPAPPVAESSLSTPSPPPNAPALQAPQRRPNNDSPRPVRNRPTPANSPQNSRPSGFSSSGSSRAPSTTPRPTVSTAPTQTQSQTQTERIGLASPPETVGVTTPSTTYLDSPVVSQEFLEDLNQVYDDVHQEEEIAQAVLAGSTVLTTGLSIGYVLWLLRGGLLLSSLLTSLPAWRFSIRCRYWRT